MADAPSLPAVLQGWDWKKDTIGRSTETVLRLKSEGQTDRYAKIAPIDHGQTLRDEAARLEWLAGTGYPTATIVDLLEHDGCLWLITHAIEGLDAARSQATPRIKVVALAQALSLLHALDPRNCPFDETLSIKLHKAQLRVAQGHVDGTDFDDQNVGKSPQDFLETLVANRPMEDPPVVTHGDASLPNFILKDSRFSGAIDCARLGLADRYQDLSLTVWSVGYNLGKEWIPVFLEAYGLPDPDPIKMSFYKSVDEFF